MQAPGQCSRELAEEASGVWTGVGQQRGMKNSMDGFREWKEVNDR